MLNRNGSLLRSIFSFLCLVTLSIVCPYSHFLSQLGIFCLSLAHLTIGYASSRDHFPSVVVFYSPLKPFGQFKASFSCMITIENKVGIIWNTEIQGDNVQTVHSTYANILKKIYKKVNKIVGIG